MQGAGSKDSPARSGERQRAVPRSAPPRASPIRRCPPTLCRAVSASRYPKMSIGFTAKAGNTLAMSTAPNPTTCRANTDASTLR